MQRSNSFKAPIYLNIYDLTTFNNYLYWFGLGIFHSGIEIDGIEYAYGAHDMPTSGIFQVEPRRCPGFIFRRSILLGTVDELNPTDIWDVLDEMAAQYTGESYNLLTKNCNHFTNDVCLKLTRRPVPGWVNRLANLGAFCSCVLPESLQVSAVQHSLEYHSSEDLLSPPTDSDEDMLLLAPTSGRL